MSDKKQTLTWPEIEEVLKVAYRGHINVLLYGPPGTGKSHAAFKVPSTIGHPERVYLTEDSGAYELVGYDRQIDGNFKFHEGPYPRAWRCGSRLVVEEISKASGDCLTCLLGVMDHRRVARAKLVTGEEITPSGNFHVVATMNDSVEYLPEALADRFGFKIYISDPNPEAPNVICDNVLRVMCRRQLVDINAVEMDKIDDNQKKAIKVLDNREFGLRKWLAIDEALVAGMSIKLAAKSIIGEHAEQFVDAYSAVSVAEDLRKATKKKDAD